MASSGSNPDASATQAPALEATGNLAQSPHSAATASATTPIQDTLKSKFELLKSFYLWITIIPLFAIGSFVLASHITAKKIIISNVFASKELIDTGLFPEFIASEIRYNISRIQKDARSQRKYHEIVDDNQILAIQIPQTSISLETISDYIENILDLDNTWKVYIQVNKISGKFNVKFIAIKGSRQILKTMQSDSDSSTEFIKQTSYELTKNLNPYILALHLRKGDSASKNEAICLLKDLSIDSESSDTTRSLAFNMLGNIYNDEIGDHSYALRAYEAAIKLHDENELAHNGRGNALLNLRKWGDSVAAFDRAIALRADYAAPWYRRGKAQFSLGRYDEALKSFNKAIDIEPRYDIAYEDRARLHEKIGETTATVQDLLKAIEHGSNTEWRSRKLAELFHNLGDETRSDHYRKLAERLKAPKDTTTPTVTPSSPTCPERPGSSTSARDRRP